MKGSSIRSMTEQTTLVWPRHIQGERTYIQSFLRRFGNELRGHYGVPVYLVGSALEEDNFNPRDWDIRLCLPDEEFMRHYAPGYHNAEKVVLEFNAAWGDLWTPTHWRWADDCIKQSRRGWKHTHLNIDFQTCTQYMWAQHENKPRLKLDTREA